MGSSLSTKRFLSIKKIFLIFIVALGLILGAMLGLYEYNIAQIFDTARKNNIMDLSFVCRLEQTKINSPQLDNTIKNLNFETRFLVLFQNELYLAKSYCLTGRFPEAIAHLESFLLLNPTDILGHLELGFAYESTGNLIMARDEWIKGKVQKGYFASVAETYELNYEYKISTFWINREKIISGKELDYIDPSTKYQTLLLDSFLSAQGWIPCSWCENGDGHFWLNDGILNLVVTNQKEQSAHFAIINDKSYKLLPNSSNLSFRIRSLEPANFSVEAVIDNQRYRLATNMELSKEWQIVRFPIKGGNIVNELLLEVDQASIPLQQSTSGLEIDWLGIETP